jgi:hypothetical protein
MDLIGNIRKVMMEEILWKKEMDVAQKQQLS